MLALSLRLPTAPYGGHMGHFLLSTLILAGSTPFGNRRHGGTALVTGTHTQARLTQGGQQPQTHRPSKGQVQAWGRRGQRQGHGREGDEEGSGEVVKG